MHCLSCGHANRDEARFCDACGTPLAGADAAPARPASAANARPAPRSYTPTHLAQKILTSRAALEGERKQVTVLFCDLADSTALAQRLGAEAMHDKLNHFFEAALAEVHKVEGTINQFLGDGFMALFGAPLAHEDHVRRAAACALAITQRLREAGAEVGSPLAQLVPRIGLNTGAVVVGKIGDNLRMDYTAIGDTTNVAARLQALAGPGQICVGDGVRLAVEAHFEFELLGPKALKGVSEPVLVHRLLRARTRAMPGPGGAGGAAGDGTGMTIGSVLVGRDAELAAAEEALVALARGVGGALLVIGEPGAGKSRLVAEMRRRHAAPPDADAATPGLRWLEGRTLSFGRHLAYWPFIEILRAAFDIAEDNNDDAGTRAASEDSARLRLEQGLVALLGAEAAADVLPYVATVLALKLPAEQQARLGYLDGPAMKRQVFACLRQIFEALARERPTLLLLEDWHWADPSSIELAEHLLPLAQTLPLLLLLPTRPGQEGPAARTAGAAAERLGARLRTLSLAPLAHDASARLIDNLVGADTLPHALRQQILWRTEGNPLFIEEVVRSLVADGTLRRDEEEGGWLLTRQPEQVKLPDTLHALILARIDRLDDDVKHALKLASVIGRTFFDRVLAAISEAQQALPGQLEELERAELIRDTKRMPEAEHIFKHALIQEAAYTSILGENRRSIHGQVARVIERLFADRLDEFASLLAHHYTCAEDWDKAQEYLFKAGDQAGRLASDHEALEHLRRAEAAYVKAFGDRLEPLARAQLGRKIGAALFGTGQNEAAHAQMRQALGHLGVHYPGTRGGVRREILRQLAQHLWRALRRRVGMPVKRRLALDVAEEISTLAHTMSWVDYFIDKERMLLDSLLELRAGETSRHLLAASRGTASVGFGWMTFGAHRMARRYHARAIAIAQRSGHPSAIAFSWFALAFVDFYDGRWDEAEARYEKAAETYRESGEIHRWGGTQVMLAFVLHARGKLDELAALGEQLVRDGDDAADPQLVSWGIQSAAYASVDTGPLPEVEAKLRRGRDMAAQIPAWDNHLYQSSLLAKCLVLQGRVDEALPIVEESLAVMKRERLQLPFDRIEVLTASATVRLALAERIDRGGHPAAFDAAVKAARTAAEEALRCARRMPCWLVEALRLAANADWLAGDTTRAHKRWREAIGFAESSAFPIARARTLLDKGRLTGDASLVDTASAILRQSGALSYVPASSSVAGNMPAEPFPIDVRKAA